MFAKIAVLTIVLFAVVYSQDSDNGHAEQMKMFDSFLTGLDLELDKKEEVLAGLLKEISRCVHNDLTIFKTVKLKFDSNLKNHGLKLDSQPKRPDGSKKQRKKTALFGLCILSCSIKFTLFGPDKTLCLKISVISHKFFKLKTRIL